MAYNVLRPASLRSKIYMVSPACLTAAKPQIMYCAMLRSQSWDSQYILNITMGTFCTLQQTVNQVVVMQDEASVDGIHRC